MTRKRLPDAERDYDNVPLPRMPKPPPEREPKRRPRKKTQPGVKWSELRFDGPRKQCDECLAIAVETYPNHPRIRSAHYRRLEPSGDFQLLCSGHARPLIDDAAFDQLQKRADARRRSGRQ